MKLTIEKQIKPSDYCKADPAPMQRTVPLPTIFHYKIHEHPHVFLCENVERVLGVTNVPNGTKFEIYISKICRIEKE
jgi:hypothetical protein